MRLLCFSKLDLILRRPPTGRANARPMTGSVAVSKDGLQYRFVIPGTGVRAIAYGIFNESSLRTQGPQRERNCAHRGGADSRFGTGGGLFSLLRPGVMGPCVRR